MNHYTKITYRVTDTVVHKTYGPMHFAKTAFKVANAIDKQHHDTVAVIDREVNGETTYNIPRHKRH